MRGGRSGAGSLGAHALAVAFVLAVASAASAARLVDVRIGVHPGFARVVLETDAAAAYDVVSTDPAEVVVRIEAASDARTLPARTVDTPSIVLEPTADGATLARIRAPGPLRVETQVLAAPPRVVLDLRKATGAEAAAPEPVAPPPEPVVVAPQPEPAQPEPPAPEPVAVAPEAEPEPVLPPVASAPPAAIALEPRSLATGLAIGFALALFAFAARRPLRVVPAESPPPSEPPAEPETAPAPESEPAPLDADSRHDLVRMYQRLDARLAEVATRLESAAERLDRLDAGSSAQGAEIASQRVAIARLRAALPPAPRSSEREEIASPAPPR